MPAQKPKAIAITKPFLGMDLKPTKTYINVLPSNAKTWHQVFFRFYEESKRDLANIPSKPKWEILKANRKLYVYEFDLDFIKARMTEEAFPVIQNLFDQIKGGQNYSRWEQLLRQFYNSYNQLVTGS